MKHLHEKTDQETIILYKSISHMTNRYFVLIKMLKGPLFSINDPIYEALYFQPTAEMNTFSELYTVNVILPFGCFLVKSSHSYMEQ